MTDRSMEKRRELLQEAISLLEEAGQSDKTLELEKKRRHFSKMAEHDRAEAKALFETFGLHDEIDKIKENFGCSTSNQFNPREAYRPPRQQGYAEETTEICRHLQQRGDQRIGQYLINAVRHSDKYAWATDGDNVNEKEAVEGVLWTIEAPELLNAIQKLEDKVNPDR